MGCRDWNIVVIYFIGKVNLNMDVVITSLVDHLEEKTDQNSEPMVIFMIDGNMLSMLGRTLNYLKEVVLRGRSIGGGGGGRGFFGREKSFRMQSLALVATCRTFAATWTNYFPSS